VTLIALVSYSAMAGVIGAGGLGNLAYLEGFQRNHGDVTLVATVTILIIEIPIIGMLVYPAVGDDGIAYPEDGFTYEFFFRIWPNAQLNGSITRDHTVNKSQIYIYSVANRDSIMDDKCETPIAKFSMARTTNFYMFGENVSIPDKPVCYRATFTYSSVEKRWMVTDYYQLPDHIFVGPVGFIDPQTPSNADVYMDSLNINPNASFIGYETAAFPMFQDPFSSTNLSPYRFTNVDDLNAFINRMICKLKALICKVASVLSGLRDLYDYITKGKLLDDAFNQLQSSYNNLYNSISENIAAKTIEEIYELDQVRIDYNSKMYGDLVSDILGLEKGDQFTQVVAEVYHDCELKLTDLTVVSTISNHAKSIAYSVIDSIENEINSIFNTSNCPPKNYKPDLSFLGFDLRLPKLKLNLPNFNIKLFNCR
jgi:hypothetical protein